MRVWIAAIALSLPVPAQSAPPPTIASPTQAQAEAIVRLYVGAVNAKGGLDAYLARDAQGIPRPPIANWFDDQRWINGGGVDLVGVRVRPGVNVVDAAVRGRLYGGVQGMRFTVTGDARPRVTSFEPTPAPAWAAARSPRISTTELANGAKRLMAKGCAAGRFSGALLVAAGHNVLVSQACGDASRRYHAANTTQTRFNLGSMDKMFTAVAAMQLVETGKMSLDATLDHYLDATWLDPQVARKVTVWNLLTHTSGLSPDVISQIENEPHDQFRALDDYKRLVRGDHLAFTPGSRFNYSNSGMLLLGAVIASASGEDYYAYVRDHVFRPAGMSATGSYAADEPVENLAVGYSADPGNPYGWRENTAINLFRGIPAGGGYSTVGDLCRFALALQSGELLSPASLRRLWADPHGYNYGGGFEIESGAVGRTVGHSGLFYGVSTRMRLYLDSGYIVVVLANMDRSAPPLLDAIEGLMVRTAG